MIKIKTSPKFDKSLFKMPENIVKLFELKEILFKNNPFHPSLKTHKLTGKLSDYFAFSINYSYRIMFKFINQNTVLFINVGTHEIYR